MSNALKSKTVDSKTVKDSFKESDQTVEQAISAIDTILNVDTKATSSSVKPSDWVGTVELVSETVNLCSSYMTTCTSQRGKIAMIVALTEKLKANNGKFTFESAADVEEFDRTAVPATYQRLFDKALKATDNPRMGHNWGLSLIGKVSHKTANQSQVQQWLANIGREDGFVAFFKVTKKSS